MLRTRVLTALVLFAVLAAAFLLLTPGRFAYALLVVTALAAFEWGRLCVPRSRPAALGYASAVTAATVLLSVVPGAAPAVIGAGALAWCLAPVLLVRWAGRLTVPAVALVLGFVVLAPAWFALVRLRAMDGGYYLWMLLALVWAADIGAYFIGRAFGRHKLASAISPGKTREGAVGGLASAAAVGAAGGWMFTAPAELHPLAWLAACLAAAAFSIVGDLSESLVKRMAGVKDSGSLLPGHGGVLDRIDGILAAAPVFTVVLWLLYPGHFSHFP